MYLDIGCLIEQFVMRPRNMAGWCVMDNNYV